MQVALISWEESIGLPEEHQPNSAGWHKVVQHHDEAFYARLGCLKAKWWQLGKDPRRLRHRVVRLGALAGRSAAGRTTRPEPPALA